MTVDGRSGVPGAPELLGATTAGTIRGAAPCGLRSAAGDRMKAARCPCGQADVGYPSTDGPTPRPAFGRYAVSVPRRGGTAGGEGRARGPRTAANGEGDAAPLLEDAASGLRTCAAAVFPSRPLTFISTGMGPTIRCPSPVPLRAHPLEPHTDVGLHAFLRPLEHMLVAVGGRRRRVTEAGLDLADRRPGHPSQGCPATWRKSWKRSLSLAVAFNSLAPGGRAHSAVSNTRPGVPPKTRSCDTSGSPRCTAVAATHRSVSC